MSLGLSGLDFDCSDDFTVWVSRRLSVLVRNDNNFLTELNFLADEMGCMYDSTDQYGGIAVMGENIIVAPFKGNQFLLLDKNGNKCKSIDFNKICNEDKYTNKMKFAQAVRYYDKIFFVGFEVPLLICFDVKKLQFREIRQYKKKVTDVIKNAVIMKQTVFKSHLYLTVWETNKIIDIEMEQETVDVFSLEENETPIGICADEEALWFGFQKQPYILKYDLFTGKRKKIACDMLLERAFYMVSARNKLYFIGITLGDNTHSFIDRFCKTDEKMFSCQESGNLGNVMAVKKRSDETIMILSQKEEYTLFCTLDTATDRIVKNELHIKDSECVNILEIMCANKQVICETQQGFGLKAFLMAVRNMAVME